MDMQKFMVHTSKDMYGPMSSFTLDSKFSCEGNIVVYEKLVRTASDGVSIDEYEVFQVIFKFTNLTLLFI